MSIRFFLALSFFVSCTCYSEPSRPIFCSDESAGSQRVYECSKLISADADGQLNSAYKSLSNKVDADYKSDPLLGSSLKEHIKRSQRAWINLRDENCAIESFMIVAGTQAFETTKNFCMARESIKRTQYLNDLKL